MSPTRPVRTPSVRTRPAGHAARRDWSRWALLSLLTMAATAQGPDTEQLQQERAERRAACAAAIQAFVDSYERERLEPRGPLRERAGLQPPYARLAHRAELLSENDFGHLTHMEALQKLLIHAERQPDEAVGAAVLSLAAAGLDRSLFDRDARVLRDLGHWTLMRMDHQGCWFEVMRTAAGRPPGEPDAAEDEDPRDLSLDPARRVAAMKLLGQKGLPVFRATIEGALADGDPRVRLAAAEALGLQRRAESLPVLTRAMGVERHPVVSQGVVAAVLATLQKHSGELVGADRDAAVRAALRMLGRSGWRTDMDLLDLLERYPAKAAIPSLIEVLERAAMPQDEIVELVNRNASPRLRDRAYQLLRGMTGAILPADDPAAWRAFWESERDKLAVPGTLPDQRDAGSTASTFFGIPVTGREIAFVIDTSGSMKQSVNVDAGTDTASSRSRRALPTRLSVAKEQLLLAVQSMEEASSYHLLTFSGEARVWSRKAVPPGPNSTRALTELLSRFDADGGTNVFDALVQALSLDEGDEQGQGGVDEMFLLSDGEPTVGTVQDTEEILALVRDANKYLKVRINTIFSGTGKGAGFLRQLAEQNGGVFVQR